MFRVALIESVAIVRIQTKEILQAEGFEVDEFPSAEAFLNLYPVRFEGFDLFIIESHGLESESFDLLGRIMSRPEARSLPVVMTGGGTSKQEIIAAIRMGAADYLLKPFDNETLLAKLRKVLAIYRPKRKSLAPQRISFDLDRLLQLEIARARRGNQAFSLIQLYFTDIENEQMTKKGTGHGGALQQGAQLLNDHLREIDLVVMTENTLLVLLPLTDAHGAQVVVRKVSELLRPLSTGNFYVEAGHAAYPDHGEDSYALLASATDRKISLFA